MMILLIISDLENKIIFKWEDVTGKNWIPTDEHLVGGFEANGEKLYVGRTVFQDEVIPGKVNHSHGLCYFAWGSKEHSSTTYQVLKVVFNEADIQWISAANGIIPSGSVEGGIVGNGKKLFIGRANHQGSLTVGKIDLDHGGLFIPYDGKEISYSTYQVLCLKTLQF